MTLTTPPELCCASAWYSSLAAHTFPASFLPLRPEEVTALRDGRLEGEEVDGVVARLEPTMRAFPGNCFVFTDLAAPTDTERFAGKRGAVHSAASAWRCLATSGKIRAAATAGQVGHLCIRPFRRMNRTREFRLFLHGGKLRGMSQYWLIRHYRRLEGRKDFFWKSAIQFVDEVSWLLPYPTIVMDVYFTAENRILIVDFNPWGPPTDPLLLRSWDRAWDAEDVGIKLIPPPVSVGGELNVSF